MKNLFETGRLNRRDFMQGLIAVGLTASTATALLTGSRDVNAAMAKKGGKLRVAWDQHGPADTNDPKLFTSSIDYFRGRCYGNNLVQFNDDISVRPELAEEFSVNAKATEFTFKLRKGVTWHDGTKLTVDDVIYTMNRHLGETTSKAKSLVSMIKEWKKVDATTFKAVLSSPNADLPAILATFHFKILQNDCDNKEDYFQNIVGTGPYIQKEFSPGVRSVHVRNDNYWREGGNVDEIEIFGITDNVARVNSLISGDVHISGNLDPKAFQQVEDAPNAEIFSVDSGATTHIVCDLAKSPGDNRDFVMALKYLQRRDRLVKSVIKNQGVVGNDHPIGPSYPDHCGELAQRPFDADKAKFHLKKSGITEAEVETSEVGLGAVDQCLVLQREAAKIGLKLNVKRVPADGYWGSIWMKKPICISAWNMRPTANVMMTLQYTGNWNESSYHNPRFDELLLAARGETDKAKAHEMYCEMQTLLSNEAGTVTPYHRNYVDAILKNVKGIPRVPLAAVGGAEFPEFVWLA